MRTKVLVVAAAALGLLAAACAPYFAQGSVLTAVVDGTFVTISWPAALEVDDGEEVASYTVFVDEVAVATVPATTLTCVVVGLAPGTEYEISVTARDTADEWSGVIGGDVEHLGRLRAPVTTTTGAAAGPMGCVPVADSDGDRLPDAVEDDTGTYSHQGATGTDPFDADTDDDAIEDGDEVIGTTAALDLPAMGTSPTHKDLIFEFDWFDDSLECSSHSHRPSAAMIDKVADAFADSPVTNPDGVTGVNVIADRGQGGALDGGNLVPDADGVIAGGVGGADYLGIKAAHFAANRNGYVHYVLMPHRYNTSSGSSGQAELYGDDMIVSLYCANSTQNVANTIVHEVGHNLGLRHGGHENANYKPNYNSVMNYRYQFPGVDTNCTPAGDGLLDFSHGTRATLDESALVEADGICGGVAVDWNENQVIDGGTVSVNINNASGADDVLADHDDWAALAFWGILDGDGAPAPLDPSLDQPLWEPEIITEQPVPAEHLHD